MDCLHSCFPSLFAKSPANNDVDAKATEIVHLLLHAEKPGYDLRLQLNGVVETYGWTEKLAEAVFNKLVGAIQGSGNFGPAMTDALEKARDAADAVLGFVKEHPVLVMILALGVLVWLAPWALEVLGFGELGPVEGMLHHCVRG